MSSAMTLSKFNHLYIQIIPLFVLHEIYTMPFVLHETANHATQNGLQTIK
jgi:hypothetical protein